MPIPDTLLYHVLSSKLISTHHCPYHLHFCWVFHDFLQSTMQMKPTMSVVRMAERSKAPDSRLTFVCKIASRWLHGTSGTCMRAWVRIPLLTNLFHLLLWNTIASFITRKCNIEEDQSCYDRRAWFKSRICQRAFFPAFYSEFKQGQFVKTKLCYGILLSHHIVSGSQDGRAV